MVALFVGKKRELGALSSMLAKTVGAVGLVAILASCGTSPGYSYTVGGTISGLMTGNVLVLQNNGGDDKSISADGAFTLATPLTDGAAYNITVKTQPTNPSQNCRVVSNGTGTIISAPVYDVEVSCMTSPESIAFSVESLGEFAYVANDDNTILTYLIDLLNRGTFTHKGTANTGTLPTSIAVAPPPPLLGKFAYAANTNDNTISAYTISTTDGTLAPLGTPVDAGKSPTAVTVDPSGKFAYVANEGDNTISAYTINSSTGALTAAIGSPVSTGTLPISIVTVSVGLLGEFVYVANVGDNTISAYTINSSTGALTAIGSPVSTGTSPVSITVDHSGQFAYVANEGSNSISIYTISTTDGTLAASTTPTVTVGTNPTSVVTVLVGSSEFAYVTNMSDSTISAYSIDLSNGGALTAISGSPFNAYPTGTSAYPSTITIDPSKQFAYVINAGDGSIWVYPINPSTGALGTPSGPL
jgi:6-phosphogluconolactonase (cycloisomerase 2 family)